MKKKIILIVSVILIAHSSLFAQQASVVTGANNDASLFNNQVTLDVKNMNILDVLRLIAEQSGLNIVASRNIHGTVTVKLQNVQIKDALEAILDSNNFTYIIDGNIIRVYSYQDLQQKEQIALMKTKVFLLKFAKANDIKQVLLSIKSPRGRIEIDAKTNQVIVTEVDESMKDIAEAIAVLDREMLTRVFKLNYASAKEIHTKLLEMIAKQEGDVFVDERTNSIMISAVPPVVSKIEVLLQSWDKRSAQVLIEAKILEITADKSKNFGIDWQYKNANDHNLDLSGKIPFSQTAGGIFKIGTLTADEYAATLLMLESTTDVNLLSAPRISVVDNKEASILVGSNEPYLVTYIDKETQTQSQDTKYLDVGIKLKVTPQIGEDNYITINIHPEVSTARRVAEVSNSLAIDTTQADTTVLVKDGNTIVVGGLIKDKKEKVVSKIPIIGDIPILGLLFRGTQDTINKKEVVVFITPHIIRPDTARDEAINTAIGQARKKTTE